MNSRIRGGYKWLQVKLGSILAQGKNVMSGRPGYLSKKHIEFLDWNKDAFRNGVSALPYLLGEFKELTDEQAQRILDWWIEKGEPPGRDKTGG